MKILVFVEQRQGKIKASAKEALSLARGLADSAGKVTALVLGTVEGGQIETIKGFGADEIWQDSDANLANYNCLTYSEGFCKAVQELHPDLCLGVASPMGRDLFARSAARLKAALLSDLVRVDSEGGQVIGGLKPMYAGKVLAKVRFDGPGLKMLTIRPNAFGAKPASTSSQVAAKSFGAAANPALTLVELRKGKSDKVDLTEASRIISGGRSLGSLDNFKILFECAEAMQGSVGASRAAVDAGYASHDMQVGQTGKTVNPNLYIACGVSGSIQHMAGMRTSKVIVAVNTDPEAPIYSIASYGIVADLFEVVPLLTKGLKKLAH